MIEKVLTVKDLESLVYDKAFRDRFAGVKARDGKPIEVLFDGFFTNPKCKCNAGLWFEICSRLDALKAHFPGHDIALDEFLSTLVSKKTEWNTIDTTVNDLCDEMNKLPKGPKQVSMALYGDRVVVLWRDLEA